MERERHWSSGDWEGIAPARLCDLNSLNLGFYTYEMGTLGSVIPTPGVVDRLRSAQ